MIFGTFPRDISYGTKCRKEKIHIVIYEFCKMKFFLSHQFLFLFSNGTNLPSFKIQMKFYIRFQIKFYTKKSLDTNEASIEDPLKL